ncbi:MAG: ParB/RepB/Spo0J family partition protein [Chloroflexota bacterium]|nr:ParB/RepB/Spo0J family partition protein [Chloroflexota bacterium]
MTETMELPITTITVLSDLQPRVAGLDEAHVLALQEASEGWPPLAVVQQGNAYVLVDGFHRFAAAQNLGLARVPARLLPLPADGDLKGLAFALNAVHGRPLSLADRRAEAERLLREWPVVSNLEVSRRAGLAPTTIATIRARLEEAAAIEAAPERIGADGTRYPVSTARSLRAPGVLPDEGLGERVSGAVGRVFTSEERRQQRQVASYFKRLAVALEDGDDLPGWETAPDAAEACRLVLGEEEAADLGERLGRTSRNVLDVAVALGYADREDAA